MSDFSMHSSCQQAVNYNFLMFSVISLLASWLKPVEESIEWKVSSPRRCVPVCRIMDEEKRRFACERTTLWMLYHTSCVEPWNTDSSAASWWEKGSKHFQRGWFLRRSEKALPIILQHARQLRRDWYLFLMNINTAILFCFFRLWDGLVAVSRWIWTRRHKHVWPCVAAVLEWACSVSRVQLSVGKRDDQSLTHTCLYT